MRRFISRRASPARPSRLSHVVAFAVACGDPAPPLGAPSTTAPEGSSAPAPAPEPRAEAPTCADARSAVSFAGGAPAEAPCASPGICCGGRCDARAELPGPGSATFPAATLRAVSDEGFLNAWSAHVGLSKKTVEVFAEKREYAALGGARSARAVCAKDGWVAPRRAADTPSPQHAVLSGVLFSHEERELELRAATSGAVVVLVGRQRIEAAELPGREGRALPDERFGTVKLEAGANEVTVLLEPETAGFFLRLRERDGRPARGLLFAERFAGAACGTAALLDVGAEVHVGRAGLDVAVTPRFRGVVPILAPESQLSVRHGPGAPASLLVPRLDLVGPGRRRTLVAPLAEKGAHDVEARLGDDVVFSRRLPDYGPLVARVAALVAAAERVSGARGLPDGSRESFAHHVATLAEAVGRGEPDRAWIARHTERAERLGAKLQTGVDAYADERGVVFRAYRSKLDGRLQPYVAFVPASHATGKELPLVLVAHGRDRLPEHALRTLVGEAPDEHMTLAFAAHNLPPMADLGALYAAPWGYGNAGVQGVGERDALAVVDEMRRAYRVDARRVSVTGYSLGGTVSFALPLHFPDVFSAAAPLCGYPNLLGYRSVADVRRLPWEEPLLAKEYLVRYAENGLHVPLHIVHGGLDVPGRSQVVADRYKALGYAHVFDVPEDLDHNVWDHAYEDGRMVPWLTRHAIPVAPRRVRLVTGKYRYHRAHWVQLTGMIDSSSEAPASIDATWDPREGRVALTTANVAGLTILSERLGGERPERLRVSVDGEQLEAPSSAEIALVRGDDGRFRLGELFTDARKRHGLSGPLDDVQHGPVTVVYGASDPAMTEANRMVAEHLATLGGTADVAYPVVRDADAAEVDLDGRHVILVGAPSQNRLTRAIASALPVQFEPSAVVLRGTRYEGPDLAVSLIFPGPERFAGAGADRRGSRYVVVHAGTSPRAVLAARFLPRYLPDYVVYDAGLAVRRGGLLMDGRPVRAAGFFGEDWR